jgi:hypothetical protein
MNRRSFLSLFAAAAVLDPEKLLWIPGKKKIFIPPAIVKPAPGWGPLLGINLAATEESGLFHNGLRDHSDQIDVLQYSELNETCKRAFDSWLHFWGYTIPTKENPGTECACIADSHAGGRPILIEAYPGRNHELS